MNAYSPDMPVPGLADLLAEFGERFASPWWRLSSGMLYKIMTKEGGVIPFLPNEEQTEFLTGLHYRNVIPKARQIGFTTASALYLLDHALWNRDQRCGMIAHKEEDAKAFFRDKVLFGYENLPEFVRAAIPLKKRAAEELLFENNSSVRVSTSMRSGTIHRLHVSELAKLSKERPDRAYEVKTGSFGAVPMDGVIIVESTSEGPQGAFYEIGAAAFKHHEAKKPLSPLEFKWFFFPWWRRSTYRMNPQYVIISPLDHQYFVQVEQEMGCKIDLWQRAWYIATRDGTLSGDQEAMWRENPSTPDECWKVGSEGTFYGKQVAAARGTGRICRLPVMQHVPVNTFWDIGSGDGTGIWFHQQVGPQHRFIRYIEGWVEGYAHYVAQMETFGYIWGTHFLPHDAAHERQGATHVWRPIDVLQEMRPTWRFDVVPRVNELIHGIQALRQVFSQLWFDEVDCKEGIEHIELYRKRWVQQTQMFSEEPVKDVHTEAADALRQFAQSFDNLNPSVRAGQTPRRTGARSRVA